MSGKATRKAFDRADFHNASDDHQRNRVIFDWICDDGDRASLYEAMPELLVTRQNSAGNMVSAPCGDQPFPIMSRARFMNDPAPLKSEAGVERGSTVYLVHNREDINRIMVDTEHFSNRPYLDIGSGGFMLGLDPLPQAGQNAQALDAHQLQRQALGRALSEWKDADIKTLSELAVREATVMSLGNKAFDLAEFSEQAGLRFCMKLFGFASSDYGLLEEALRRAYRAMNYQMLGRHFLSEPLTLPAAREWMGRLASRISQLMDEYQSLPRYPRWDERLGDPRAAQRLLPEGVEPLASFGLSGAKPVLQALATLPHCELTGQERVVVAVGTLAGIVGNIQASVCIAFEHILSGLKDKKIARNPSKAEQSKGARMPHDWQYIDEAMKLNPPAPYLPRIVVKEVKTPSGLTLKDGDEVILMIGAGTNDPNSKCPFHHQSAHSPTTQREDSLIFGLGPNANVRGAGYSEHWCIGDFLARPIIEETVRVTLSLPGLSRRYDPITAEPLHLEKRWGFACERFALSYKRESLRAQQTLNVVMRIKAPVPENAERLKRVIAGGAPRIQQALINARHVHFAWFEMIENETKLVLHTVYDGDFEAYVAHFAMTVDDMFDQLFSSIEGAPPLPVRDYPNEFVETLRRFNLPPLAGFLFSAYPSVETHEITAASTAGRL